MIIIILMVMIVDHYNHDQLAAAAGRVEIVELLLSFGASPFLSTLKVAMMIVMITMKMKVKNEKCQDHHHH